MEQTVTHLNQKNDIYSAINDWRQHLNQRVLGQPHLIDCLLISILCDGHLLIEGAPGLAKTRIIRELAAGLDARICLSMKKLALSLRKNRT